MSIVEMKWKIVQQLDTLSEDALKEVLALLQENKKQQGLHQSASFRTDINAGLDERIERNIELLKKLA